MDSNQRLTDNRLWESLGKPGLGGGMLYALAALLAAVLIFGTLGWVIAG